MSFKDEYAKFKQPSQARENFVYNAITSLPKEQILKSMKPITVKKPDGSEVTYKVMTDYVSIDGFRVPMSGQTAQRVADHFGLSLPSSAQTKEIYDNSVKIPAKPLSGSGTTIDGKNYSGNDVVNTGVGYAPFAVTYNDKINKQLEESGAKPGDIVSGFAKDIVAPPANGWHGKPGESSVGALGLHGFYDANGKPIQGGNGQTPHDTSVHSEYGAFARFVTPYEIKKYPDGKVEKKQNNYGRYTVEDSGLNKKVDMPDINPSGQGANKPLPATKQYAPPAPQSGRNLVLERAMNIIDDIAKKL